MKAFLVAGDRSGSGKTSITLALSALLSTGRTVQTFKVGMDYIDPSYLAGVTGRPCRNLDGYVMSPAGLEALPAARSEIAVVGASGGLFRGQALRPGSTAAIAKLLDLPWCWW